MKIYLSSDSTVIPGTVLSTAPSSLYIYGVPIGPFPGVLLAPVSISSVLVPRLSVRLSIPSVLNLCSAAVAIAAVESYGDPRPLLYTWTVTGSTIDVSTMQTRLASVTGPVLQLSKSDMLPGHSYGLGVRVKSPVFGALGGANATVERLTVLNPTVSIDGAPELSPPLTGDLLLHGTVDYSTCTSLRAPTPYLFQWSVQPDSLALDDRSSQSSSLLVPAASLIPWVSYLFTLSLMRASGDVYSTATIQVTPRTVPPIAVLFGGDRTVRINSTIRLNGSGSFDPVLGKAPQTLLSYNLTVTSGPLSTPAALLARDAAAARPIGGGVDEPIFQVPAAALGEGEWSFCLTVVRVPKDATPLSGGPGDDAYTPSAPDCVTITVTDDAIPEVGIDIPSGVIDGTLRLLATERITAYGTIADPNMVPIRTMFTLSDAAEPGVFNTGPMLTPPQTRAPVAPYLTVINTSALDADDHIYTLTFYAWFDGVSGAATASRTFTLPEAPRVHGASPSSVSSIVPNPAPSFPQRFVLVCPEWYSSAPRFLPLRYSAWADGFPVVDNNYSPVSTFYLPRLPGNVVNTLTVSVSDWRNQSVASTLQGSWSPDVGTLSDLLAYLNAASLARDVGALPALAYQALMWIANNATDPASPEMIASVRAVMLAVKQALPFVPATRASVTQLVAIARLAGALVGPNMSVEALNVGADVVSTLCKELPEDLGTDVRLAIVDIIRSLLTGYASIYDGPNKASISYSGLDDVLECVTEVLAPISGLDQPPITISTGVAQFQSHTLRRSELSGRTFGSDGWPQFTLPDDFADTPSLADYDVLQVSYTASLVNSFTSEKFVAPIGSLTILDAGGKEVEVSGLSAGVRISFLHSAPAPRNQEGDMEPVYCIYWDDDAGVFSNLGCFAARSSDNDTECVCDHLTSFAISYSATFAPRGSRRFPIVLVAAVIGGALLLGVCALVVALLVARARRADGGKAKRRAQEEAQAHATDMAVLRSEITQKPACDPNMADAELRAAVHQEMARAGLTTPPLAPPPFAVPTREAPHHTGGKRDSLTSDSLGSAVPVGGEEDGRSAAAESDEQQTSVASAAAARVALPAPLPSSEAVPRKSEDRSHRGGGLRFWNKEMAYHSSDQVSSSVHSHSNV